MIRGARRARIAGWTPRVAVAALASGQHGVVARRQLVALGMNVRAIERAVAAGHLHLVHRGMYAVGHRSPTRDGRFLAAVLASGPDAVLSHRSAAVLWGLTRYDGPVEITRGYEVDAIWPGASLIVELDGRAAHATRAAFEADRERDRRLAVLGWRVVRVTWRQLTLEPEAVTADLEALLARGGRHRTAPVPQPDAVDPADRGNGHP